MKFTSICAYAVLALALTLLIALPLSGVVSTLLQDAESITLSRSNAELLYTTLLLSVSVTAIATALGTLSGMGLLFLPRWLRYIFLYAAMIAFFVPAYIYTSAWIQLTSYLPGFDTRHLFSLPGVVGVLSFIHFPIVTCATYVACMRIEHEKLEIVRMEGSVYSMFRHVLLPHALPFMCTGALMVFLLSLTTYTVPSFFQVTTYSIEIFTLYNAFHNPASGVQLLLPILGVALIAIAVWWCFIRHHLSHTSVYASKHLTVSIPVKLRLIIIVGITTLFLLSVGLPLATIALNHVSLNQLREVWISTQHEWFTSLSLAIGTTFIILCISSAGTFLCDSLPRGLGLVLMIFLCIPFLISGPAWGIGLIQCWNHHGLRGDIYDHPLIAYLACTGKYLFVGWLGFTFALRSIRQEYTDAARVFGLSRLHQYRTVILPLTAPYAVALGGITFLLVLGEVDSLVLVSPPGFTTIPVRVFGLMHYGPSPLVSAMALHMVIIVGLVLSVLGISAAWIVRGRNQNESESLTRSC